MPVDDALAEANGHVSSLRATVRRLETEKRHLTSELREYEQRDAEIARAGSLRFKPTIIKPEAHTAGSPGYPMTMWSDWHWGETVRRSETGGINAFSRPIAQRRTANLVNGTLKLLRDYAGRTPEYPGIWVCLGGDLVSGTIHDELRETNWGTLEEQVLEVGDAISGALAVFADEFGEVHVPCVVGNHGRQTHKPRAKARVRENREYGLYKSLERHFADDERVHFYVPEETDYRFSVYGHRFLLTHGDTLGVKGGDGIIGAIGPIQRGNVKIGRAESIIGRDYDTLVIGHWHSDQPRGDLFPVIVNGTLKGYDEYARLFLRAPPGPPSQRLWLVSPKHGVAAQWRVDV